MAKIRVCYVILFFFTLSFAREKIAFSHTINKTTQKNFFLPNKYIPRDSVRILAIMVEFQKDATDQTTGDGTFQKQGSPAQIDPPPHDSTYFKNKLHFLENYYRKVSNGILTVKCDLCSQYIVTLSKTMSAYAPPTSLDDKKKLVELIKESWQKADTIYPTVDFSCYDAFVIFHAGAGRDIDLVSMLGYNPTPYDIPSLYIDSASIANSSGMTAGIPLHDSTVFIKNSIILPETESRIISTGFGDDTLHYGINGLFAASLGNFLGLPDLFNTVTGRSGIGQFGLMDGASIFAYNGLFPPEPCAWEKIYLGWVKPITISNSVSSLQVPAVGLTNSGQDTIYKIAISNSEYFLLENRNRNPENSGINIDIVKADGSTVVQHYDQDTTNFNWQDATGIHGSVVNVSNFDWALIGETDGTGKYDGGGILIWHVDENVIENGLKTNSVNTDINHRGMSLEEADGSKDIGQSYEFLTAGYGTENGSPLDCWFQGNSAPLYKNIFDNNSFPNSNSYSGAASLIKIKDFSIRAPRMNVTVEVGNQALIKRDPALYHKTSTAVACPSSSGKNIIIPSQEGLFAFQSNGRSLTNDPTGILPATKNIGEVSIYQSSDSILIVGTHRDTLEILQLTHSNINGAFDSIRVFNNSIGQIFTTTPCIYADTILVGTDSGFVCKYSFTGNLISKYALSSQPVSSFALFPAPQKYFSAAGNNLYNGTNSITLPASSSTWIIAGAVSPGENFIVAAEKNGNRILSYNQSLSQNNFDKNVAGSDLEELAIADIDGDGEKDIIAQTATNLSVLNRLGILLDGFPVQAKGNNEFTGVPLIADLNKDNHLEIITFTSDGEMWVYNQRGKLMPGYPIQVASGGKIYPSLYVTPSDTIGIAVLSERDSINAFIVPNSYTASSFIWWQHYCDGGRKNSDWSPTTFNHPSQELLPKLRVYNWPNPVYGNSTHIRYYTSQDANITITIMDISGVKITELKGRGMKGMDNEIAWDVSGIQSGVYLARVEAQSPGMSDVTFVKIAVVK